MAKYLTSKETQAALENIILNAQKSLVLISPYLKLTNPLRSRIKAAAEKGVKVTIVFRSEADVRSDFEILKAIKNVKFKCTDDLHAKCYFNESQMIITSLNLLESSGKNWEIGLLINIEEDKEIYNAAVRDCRTIYSYSNVIESLPEKKTSIRTHFKNLGHGYCIRCSREIPFNMDKPFCLDCFSIWSIYGNEEFVERTCHSCGDYAQTVRLRPFCEGCYVKYGHVPAGK